MYFYILEVFFKMVIFGFSFIWFFYLVKGLFRIFLIYMLYLCIMYDRIFIEKVWRICIRLLVMVILEDGVLKGFYF